ncbi:MAG: hypothetical protein CVT62_01995 [Actinobacteria bacterium HGW-Actinobacteria-2]|nr:MAG: hypothetical protein CVT62_01995 [Actinobacteria bacterium HGW-Actinobacteria-2]
METHPPKESIVADYLGVSSAEILLLKNLRIVAGVSGLASLAFGIVILVWPEHTAMAVVGIFVVLWTLVAGLGNIAVGIFGSSPGKRRISYLALGLLFLIAGIVAWANLGAATEVLAIMIGVIVGVGWIIQGAVVLFTSRGEGAWPVIYAVVSILAGVVLLMAPFWAAALLWLWLGISLVVVGVVQLVRAFQLGRASAV